MNEKQLKQWQQSQEYHLKAAAAAEECVKAIKADKPTSDFLRAEEEYHETVNKIVELRRPAFDTEFVTDRT